MRTTEEYLRQAAQCEQLASRAISDFERETLLHIAEAWRQLAEARQRQRADGETTG